MEYKTQGPGGSTCENRNRGERVESISVCVYAEMCTCVRANYVCMYVGRRFGKTRNLAPRKGLSCHELATSPPDYMRLERARAGKGVQKGSADPRMTVSRPAGSKHEPQTRGGWGGLDEHTGSQTYEFGTTNVEARKGGAVMCGSYVREKAKQWAWIA
jgi:hypothetical protein